MNRPQDALEYAPHQASSDEPAVGKPIDVILVHGTFARGTAWTVPDQSPLCQALLDRLGNRPVRFHRFKWSGHNDHDDRRAAGKALARDLTALVEAPHSGASLVVGHSHGGTVIAHAIAGRPELSDALAGVVFLSTPFVQLQRRPYSRVLLGVLGTVLGMVLILGGSLGVEWMLDAVGSPRWLQRTAIASYVVLALLVFQYLVSEPAEVQHPGPTSWRALAVAMLAVIPPAAAGSGGFELLTRMGWSETPAEVAAWALAAVSFGIAALILSRVFPHLHVDDPLPSRNRIDAAVDRLRNEFAVRHLRPDRTLFVRMNADEASAGLTWVQAASRALSELVALSLRLGARMNPGYWERRFENSRLLWLFYAPLMLATAWAIANDYLYPLIGWSPFASVEDWPRAAAVMEGLRGLADAVRAWFSRALVAMVTLLAAGFVLVVATLVVFSRAFGRWFLWTALFVEVTVESVPPGRWSLLQFENADESPNWDGIRATTLAHSKSYQDPCAIEATVNWLAGRAGCVATGEPDSERTRPGTR